MPNNLPITWRRVSESDFPLVREWLTEPLVARWWNHETSPEAVERDFGPSTRGEEPNQDWLALLDGHPFGLIQRSAFADYPEYRDPLAKITEIPPGTLSLDYFIAIDTQRGQGLGVRMIRSMVAKTWTDHPSAPCIIIPVAAGNRRSWRALEKAGFQRVAQGALEPDNPIDPPLHYIQRIDRPIERTGSDTPEEP